MISLILILPSTSNSNPNKILCIGLNYEKHRIETKREVSGYPTIFTRFPDTQVAHNQFLVKPNTSDRFDFEGELAVIMEKVEDIYLKILQWII